MGNAINIPNMTLQCIQPHFRKRKVGKLKKEKSCVLARKYTHPVLRISGCTLYSLAKTKGTIPWGKAACFSKLVNPST